MTKKKIALRPTFTAVDIETTGQLPGVDRVLIVDLATFQNGKFHSGKTFWIHPSFELSTPLLRFIRKKKSDFVCAQLLHNVSGEIRKHLKEHQLVFYHSGPDLQFLGSEFKFTRRQMAAPPIDLLYPAMDKFPNLPMYNLEAVCKKAGIRGRRFAGETLAARQIGELAIRLSPVHLKTSRVIFVQA